MSIALQTATASVSGNTAVATFGSAVTEGSDIVVVVFWDGTSSTITAIHDVQLDDFVLLEGPTRGQDSSAIYQAHDVAGGTTAVTVVLSGTFLMVIALEYPASLKLLAPADAIDQFAANSASSGTMLSSGATAETTNATDLLICYGGSEAENASFIATGDFAMEATIDDAVIGQCMFVEDQTVSSVGEYTGTATMGTNQRWSCAVIALKFTPTFSISGSAGVAGASVAYTGPSSGSVTSDGSGNYEIDGLAVGSYVITPSKTGYSFAPPSRNETISDSDISGVNFTATHLQIATPTFAPAGGSYRLAQSVVVSDTDSGESGFTMYYTTDGSTPTTGSTVYSGPITVAASLTLKVLAVATGFINSNIGSAVYVIGGSARGTRSK